MRRFPRQTAESKGLEGASKSFRGCTAPGTLVWAAVAALVLCGMPVLAQQPPMSTPAALPATPPSNAVAATVNGQPIPEAMVKRGLDRILPGKREEARKELLNFLIDNLLIEQYLVQMKIVVEKAEVDKRIADMRAAAEKEKKNFDAMLKELNLSEAELREHMNADIRWDKYATAQATDKAMRELFDANKEMFDGAMVRARHILMTVTPEQSAEQCQSKLAGFKKEIQEKVAAGLAKLPPTSDALAREKARTSLTDEEFTAKARTESACPSKSQGGDVSWFQRAGMMVEPFAKAAFALKTYEVSDVVKTQFGYHLIMVTDRKAGRDVKFEDVKEDVKEIYCERLRENLAAQLRAKSKIEIIPPAK
jgi:peptidyl-prolyl cis-trans isomerase C